MVKSVPVIHLLLSVRTFSIRPVEPDFMYFTIIGEQFRQLPNKKIIVTGRVSITFRIPVPGRKIYSKLHIIFVTGSTKFFHYIALSVFPRRRGHGMFGSSRWPKAETVVMFCSQKHHFKAGFLEGTYPLFSIQFRRIKERGIFFPVPPFTSGKGVDTKMKESC